MTSSSEPPPIGPVRDEWYRLLRPRLIVGVLAAVALADFGAYWFVVRPSARAAQDREDRIAALVAEVATARASLQVLQAQAGAIETAERVGDELVAEIALPRRSAFSDLLTELEAASQTAGIAMRETNYAIAPLEDNEDYGVLAVDATFRGAYENLIRFLHRLDASQMFFIIGSLGATPRGERDSNELQVTMRFDTLVRDL